MRVMCPKCGTEYDLLQGHVCEAEEIFKDEAGAAFEPTDDTYDPCEDCGGSDGCSGCPNDYDDEPEEADDDGPLKAYSIHFSSGRIVAHSRQEAIDKFEDLYDCSLPDDLVEVVEED